MRMYAVIVYPPGIMAVEGFQAICFDLDETLLDDARGQRLSADHTVQQLVATYPGLDGDGLLQDHFTASNRIWSTLEKTPRLSVPAHDRKPSFNHIRGKVRAEALAASGITNGDKSPDPGCGCRPAGLPPTTTVTRGPAPCDY